MNLAWRIFVWSHDAPVVAKGRMTTEFDGDDWSWITVQADITWDEHRGFAVLGSVEGFRLQSRVHCIDLHVPGEFARLSLAKAAAEHAVSTALTAMKLVL